MMPDASVLLASLLLAQSGEIFDSRLSMPAPMEAAAGACDDLAAKAKRLSKAADECDEDVRLGRLSSCVVELSFTLPGVPSTLSPNAARALANRLMSVAVAGDEEACIAKGGVARKPGFVPYYPHPTKKPIFIPTPQPKPVRPLPGTAPKTAPAPAQPQDASVSQWILGPALKRLKSVPSGKAIGEFLENRGIKIVYKEAPRGAQARYDIASDTIEISPWLSRTETELSAALGHEGFHAMQAQQGAVPGTIEMEQDGAFVEHAIYHELVCAGHPTTKGSQTEISYTQAFKPLAAKGDLSGFNGHVHSTYQRLGFRSIAMTRPRDDADRIALQKSAQLHRDRQEWARRWLNNHRGEF